MRFDVYDAPPEALVAAVDDGLEASNRSRAPLADVRSIACAAYDASGAIVGGALGRTWGECAELLQLWVAQAHRRRGVGATLIKRYEAHAVARGCRTFYLTTFSFQAPSLYRSLGYEVALEITGYPDGISKYVMTREIEL